ncbi:hypothetical protein DPMN_093495 [Dreissena polymorpha]|uniref:Uncharacterized protein n=1 Tax=Dreissena polymorpha TaxID=45954 RepID=A0A9D4L3F2_DREPO|nr:hypothetical protein DPMN_093495 [Dreissena polymorpha]
MKINGSAVGPARMIIWSNVYEENIHVAPISQEMLLGFDFIQGRSVLDYVNDTFCIDEQDESMNVAVTNGKPEVCRVTMVNEV